ncbi:MAG: RimK-like ATPgrasp N-terminal domain-containing protein, partial [Chlamydiia bacterium]|nr:RimK-like ATPgrasp N-terminal domain-containing protein [Chlamydiia bacterium]
MKTILVVDRLSDWKFDLPELEVITGKDYLSNSFKKGTGRVRICNVCNSFNYQKLGYYVSLIAAARGDKPTPSLTCIEDIKNQGMIRLVNSELEEVIQKSLESLHSNSFVLSMYFGKNLAKRH